MLVDVRARACAGRMSSLEVTTNKYGESLERQSRSEEVRGLVEQAGAPAEAKPPAYQDDEGILPVILEDYLERAGLM